MPAVIAAAHSTAMRPWQAAAAAAASRRCRCEILKGKLHHHQPIPLSPSAWEQFLQIPGNDRCCDCGHAEPRWASINLGITLCIRCSGVHRSLGVHHSKVRSLTLDAWEPEIAKVMMELGNQIVNWVYEARVDGSVQRATENCERGVRETWIRAKYVDRRFVRPLMETESPPSDVTANVTGDGVAVVSPVARRWSVRRLRRRPNSRSRSQTKAATVSTVDELETAPLADAAAAIAEPPVLPADDNGSPRLNAIDEDVKSTQSSSSAGSVLVIGGDLAGPQLRAELALSSDQESTGEEDADDAAVGMSRLYVHTIARMNINKHLQAKPKNEANSFVQMEQLHTQIIA